jgi:hypothetical protein
MNPGDEMPQAPSDNSRALHPAVREARLVERIDALKAGLATVRAPAALEERLLRQFRDHKARSAAASRPRLWWMPPLALAAAIGVTSWIVRSIPPLAPHGPDAALAAEAGSGPFLALKPLDRIALEPAATVVTTQFPRALLAQWGLPVSPERAGEPVRAEMLYSPEGEALAVRLLD